MKSFDVAIKWVQCWNEILDAIRDIFSVTERPSNSSTWCLMCRKGSKPVSLPANRKKIQ